ncbi:unnamed protein product [Chironomus riparius]|uniref:NACHT domain-containing protein n=1 Tax=Chironomus riparius TaxID=315576 RepID=A0A9N9X166_9DIPT|nr:unnamed protein product [Chironomus riparius]
MNQELNIIDNNCCPIDQRFIFEMTKSRKNTKNEGHAVYKILKFSSEWTHEEVIRQISKLSPSTYPNLFIFVVELNELKFLGSKSAQKNVIFKIKLLKNILLNFCENRSAILQVTSKTEKITKFYYKEKRFDEFLDVSLQQNQHEVIKDFSTFLKSLLKGELPELESDLIDQIIIAEHFELILKIIQILEFSKKFYNDLILKCAAKRSSENLMDIWNIQGHSFEDEIANTIINEGTNISGLSVAVENSNIEVVNFLVKNMPHLISKLPFEHQIEVTTTALNSKNYEILCDLIEFADFPFPKGFETIKIDNTRLCQILKDREEFSAAILEQNIEKMSKFIENNSTLKIVYSIYNESALCLALDTKNFKSFCYLKSLGFLAIEFDRYKQFIDDDKDLELISEQTMQQTKDNVEDSLADEQKAVKLLTLRSFIHNKRIDKQTEVDYRRKIKKWYKDIYDSKFGSELLDAASQCSHLKIIFDFECKTIENMDMQDIGALGSTYTGYKWIFIAAQTSDNLNQELQIKGIIAHELCHYVLRIVYENQEKPYRICSHEVSIVFEAIVSNYKELLSNDIKDNVDDGCEGIISTVYKKYASEDHVAELIVRVPQILAQFVRDPEKCNEITTRFNLLFDFYEQYVVPELRKFNLTRLEDIRKLNKNIGILKELEQNLCDFSTTKEPCDYINEDLVIIITNIPKLFLISIFNYFQNKYANFIDSSVIFTASDILKNQSMFTDFKKVVDENRNLCVFVDCFGDFGSNIKHIVVNSSSKYFFVVFYDEDYDDLAEYLKDVNAKITKKEISFFWNDLDPKTQENLLKSKVKFQTKPKIPLIDLLEVKNDQNENLNKILDYQLLDLLINRSEVTINVDSVNIVDDKAFKSLFKNRILIKTFKIPTQDLNEDSSVPVKAINSIEVFPDEMLQNSTNNNIILISDVAGTGKSWILKNITTKCKTQYPQRWITYVNLNQCINLIKSQKTDITYVRFMTQLILKSKNNFEKRIYEKMYKNGATCVLFDGYDEIAADYGSFLIKMFRSFEANNGNQLWITTRDYLEKDLQEKLHLTTVYKIKPFTKSDGIDLIALHWMVDEIEEDSKTFHELAQALCSKISSDEHNLIGIPQFYALIADVFKDNKITDEKISNYFIYFKFVEKQFGIWAYENVASRKQDRIDAESKSLTYTEIHQYLAMRGLFPNISQFCQLIRDIIDWPDNKIADCGMTTKIEDILSFSHKTLMEYFAADFIVKNLKNNYWQNFADFFRFLTKFLTDPRFNIVRMFFNDALSDGVVLRKLDNKIQRFSKEFSQNSTGLENFSAVFKENQENLVNFLLLILKNGSYDKVKNLLHQNIREIISNTQNSQQIIKFQSFYIGFLTPVDLKDFLVKRNVLVQLINSKLDLVVFEDLIERLEEEIDVKHLVKHRDHVDRNLLSSLCWSKGYNADILAGILKLVKKYLNNLEIFDMIEKCDSNGNNMLHICVEKQNGESLIFTWKELENFCSQFMPEQKFKDIINQQTSINNHSLLHLAASCKNLDFHSIVWNLVSKNLENREDLWSLISKQDKNGYNFVHHLVSSNTAIVVDFTFLKLKERLSDAHFKMILNSKGFAKRNLLQTAVCNTKDINLHQVLWTVFKNTFKSGKELLDVLNEVDIYFWNVFQLAASFTTDEIFEFIINEVEQICQIEEIKKVLANTKTWKRSLLLTAAECNKSAKLHETLWTYIQKYFNSTEVMEIVRQTSKDGKNLLMITSEKNTQEVTNLTWKQILKSIDKNENNINELIKMIQPHEVVLKSILNIQIFKDDSTKIPTKNLISDPFGIFPSKQISYKDSNDLRSYASCDRLEVHESLWEFMIKTFENRDELQNLILQKDDEGNNFLHLLTISSTSGIIEYTFGVLKNNFNFKQFQDTLNSKGFHGRNLFHTAACASRNIEVHRTLLTNLRTSCKSEKDVFATLNEVDDEKRNILECLLCFSSPHVTNFMIEELLKIESSDLIKNQMENINAFKENLPQSVIRHNKSIDSHQNLWTTLCKYFDTLELMEMIKHNDIEGKNILQASIAYNSVEILKTTWQEVNNIADNFDGKELIDLIQHKDINGRNLMHLCIDSQMEAKLEFLWTKIEEYFNNEQFEDFVAQQSSSKGHTIFHHAAYCQQVDFHAILWTLVKNSFKSYDKLKNLALQVDKDGNNFLHLSVVESDPKVIEVTFKILQESLNEADYCNILKSTGFEGRNIIQRAICESDNPEMHQNLWKIIKTSDKMFLQIIGHKDDHKNNIFHLLACFSSCEIFDLTVTNLEKVASREEIKNLIISLDFWKRNFLQIIAESDKSLKFHKSLWAVIQKHLDAHELFEMIKNRDEDGKTYLKTINDQNDQNLIVLSWDEMSKFVNGSDQDEKELMDVIKNYDSILNFILKAPNVLNDPFQILMTSTANKEGSNDLQAYVTCDQIKVHQGLWDYLLKTFQNQEELKNFIIQKDEEGKNYIQVLVAKNKIEIIEFTFRVINDIFDDSQYLEIVKSKTSKGSNLLQFALQVTTDINIIKFIWRVLENSSKSDQEFSEFLIEVNSENRNILNICAAHSTEEALEFLISKLNKIESLENNRQH